MLLLQIYLALVAGLWLLYRILKFHRLPIGTLVQDLNIDIPIASRLIVDAVGPDSIRIRWNSPKQDTPIQQHSLYVNNSLVASFPADNGICQLTGFAPHTEYRIDLVTRNVLGFVNNSPTVFLGIPDPIYNQLEDVIKLHTILNNWKKIIVISHSQLSSIPKLNDSLFPPPPPDPSHLVENSLIKELALLQLESNKILWQNFSLLQNFNSNKLNLQKKLNELRLQLVDQNDHNKVIRSSIGSMENSKVLSDLKITKLQDKIKLVKTNITKMENRLYTWLDHSEKFDEMYKDTEKFYESKLSTLNDKILGASKKITSLQEEITQLEASIKNLVTKLKTEPMTNIDQLRDTINNIGNELPAKARIPLQNNPNFLKAIQTQLAIDSRLDLENRHKLDYYSKTIDSLQKQLTKTSIQNNNLKQKLVAKPYTPAYSNYSSPTSSPLLSSKAPAAFNGSPFQPEADEANSYSDLFPYRSIPVNDGASSSSTNFWSVNSGNEDQYLDYESANHLLTGLHDMIYDETDYPTNISTNSKGFTTDELDNYWQNQKEQPKEIQPTTSSQHQDFIPMVGQRSRGSSMQMPLADLISPLSSSSLQINSMLKDNSQLASLPNQSLLEATLNNSILLHHRSASNSFYPANEPIFFNTATPTELHDPSNLTKEPVSASPFGKLWETSPKQDSGGHKKTTSTSSIASNLSKLNFMHRQSTSSSAATDKVVASPKKKKKKDLEPIQSDSHNDELGPLADDQRPAPAARRMSKLLSKSGMNHLFKISNHES